MNIKRATLIVATGLALSLPGCSLSGLASAPPAPLEQTVIDDKALDAAWRSLDVAVDAINLLLDAGVIKPGSDRALAVADALDRSIAALSAAENAVAALSADSYRKAMNDAEAALADLRVAIGKE